jgi:hypothetical protein
MSIKQTAYDTIACSGFKTSDILNSLTEAKIQKSLNIKNHDSKRTDLKFKYNLVQGGNTPSDSIRFFGHPILFNTGEKDNHGINIKELAVDVRNFGKWYQPTEEFVVRNRPEYKWNIQRLILNQYWLVEKPELLRDISILPASVYSCLISECITRRFALNPLEQSIVSILSCYFYFCSFTNSKEFDEFEYTKLVSSIARATKLDAQFIFDTLEYLDKKVLNSLEDLTKEIKDKTQNISLKDLNTGILFAICCNTWFGNNAREVLAVGLEHPPTWIMIVYASINESTFKKSVLSKISERFDKRDSGDNFIKSLNVILSDEEFN